MGVNSATRSGLSPRVRGNPPKAANRRKGRRSIPACAGEPHCKPAAGHLSKVYPRVCGGTHTGACAAYLGVGLSPRVRGNPSRSIWGKPGKGSIPACAGEPSR